MDIRRLLRKSSIRRHAFTQRVLSHNRQATSFDQMTLGPVRGAAEAIDDLHVTADVRPDAFWIKPVYGPGFDLLGPDKRWIRDRVTELVRQRAFINFAAQLAPGRSRRKDLEGMPALIDVAATMRFSSLRQSVIDGVSLPLQRQLHLTLVTGSVVAGDRLKAMGCTSSDVCAIDNVRHDADHLFWGCTAMKIRTRPFVSQIAKLTAYATARGPNVSTYLLEHVLQECWGCPRRRCCSLLCRGVQWSQVRARYPSLQNYGHCSDSWSIRMRQRWHLVCQGLY